MLDVDHESRVFHFRLTLSLIMKPSEAHNAKNSKSSSNSLLFQGGVGGLGTSLSDNRWWTHKSTPDFHKIRIRNWPNPKHPAYMLSKLGSVGANPLFYYKSYPILSFWQTKGSQVPNMTLPLNSCLLCTRIQSHPNMTYGARSWDKLKRSFERKDQVRHVPLFPSSKLNGKYIINYIMLFVGLKDYILRVLFT